MLNLAAGNYSYNAMKKPNFVLYFFAIMLLASSCFLLESFETHECGDKYLHVYYGGGVGGYKLVILNHQKSMYFRGEEWYNEYKLDSTPKVVFDHSNTIAVSCGKNIDFLTSIPPAVNTMESGVSTSIVAPHETIDVDTTAFDHVIR